MNDSDDPFKELDEELDNLRLRAQDHAPPEVTTETVIEYDDELLTADTELTSDSDILAEFRPSDDNNNNNNKLKFIPHSFYKNIQLRLTINIKLKIK